MQRRLKPLMSAATLILATCLAAANAVAQSVPDIVGTWSLVSLTVVRSGTATELLGPHPRGQLIFGNDGRYVLLVLRSDLPKFADGNRESSTAQENKALVDGSVAHFGTYTIDAARQSIVFHIQKSTFPNWDGETQRRPFTLTGDRLTYMTPGSFGYGASTVVWQREK